MNSLVRNMSLESSTVVDWHCYWMVIVLFTSVSLTYISRVTLRVINFELCGLWFWDLKGTVTDRSLSLAEYQRSTVTEIEMFIQLTCFTLVFVIIIFVYWRKEHGTTVHVAVFLLSYVNCLISAVLHMYSIWCENSGHILLVLINLVLSIQIDWYVICCNLSLCREEEGTLTQTARCRDWSKC